MLFNYLIWLILTCVLTHFFAKHLSFQGVFYLIFAVLFFNAIALLYEIYLLWFFNYTYTLTLFQWANLGNNLFVYFAFRIDVANLLIVFVMSTGSLFVFWFVFIDMWDDKENFSFLINLGYFLIFMIITVCGNNLFVFYLGWEGIGIMSLILVSFWSERVRSLKATYKIFFITKIGDFFILTLICYLILLTNDVDFYSLNNNSIFFAYLPTSTQFFLALLVLLSGSVKSAQIGFHVWLLEAMEAPLGASALMHSSTLVIAGIVFISKVLSILTLNIYITSLAYLIGLITASTAAFVACFQFELKVIMAYSTISNMGYLLILLVTASLNEFLYLLVIHAYIKIFLFLNLGAIILHANNCQDLRWINQITLYNPTLYMSLFLGLINLSGLPFTSGYFCKQSILLSSSFSIFKLPLNDVILIFSYFSTFIYNFRLFFLLAFNPKLGHVTFFKRKNNSLFIIFNFFILLSILLFFKAFLIIIQDVSFFYYLPQNLIFLSKTFFYMQSPQVYAYSLWILVYSSFSFVLIYLCILNLNSINFFKKYFLINLFLFSVFCFYLVICLHKIWKNHIYISFIDIKHFYAIDALQLIIKN